MQCQIENTRLAGDESCGDPISLAGKFGLVLGQLKDAKPLGRLLASARAGAARATVQHVDPAAVARYGRAERHVAADRPEPLRARARARARCVAHRASCRGGERTRAWPEAGAGSRRGARIAACAAERQTRSGSANPGTLPPQ